MDQETVPLTVRLRLVSANSGRPVPGCRVDLWHCDHASGGRQISDPSGWVAFRSSLPGMSAGHWPHLHFRVYRDGPDAAPVHAAELALPGDGRRDAGMRLAADACFADGWPLEIPSVTGDASRGLVATRTVDL